MNKHVSPSTVDGDEAEALLRVEPLDGSLRHGLIPYQFSVSYQVDSSGQPTHPDPIGRPFAFRIVAQSAPEASHQVPEPGELQNVIDSATTALNLRLAGVLILV